MSADNKFKILDDIIKDSVFSEWCVVDIHNNFSCRGVNFKISEKVDDYKVYKKAWEEEDFTNESNMDKVLVVLDKLHVYRFYNENIEEINKNFIEVTP